MINNKKCPVCNKEFHACKSCGLNHSWEYKYCCRSCYEKSEEYLRTKFIFESIYKKMKNDSLHGEFIELLYHEYEMKEEFSNWIIEIEK